MANETIVKRSSYGEMIASETVTTGNYSANTPTAIASISAITTTEKDYPTLDFKLILTSGTGAVADNAVINLYRIASDSNSHAEPDADLYNGHYVGSFVLDSTHTSGGYAYLYGVSNVDQNDLFQWENPTGVSVVASLQVRTRSVAPAA